MKTIPARLPLVALLVFGLVSTGVTAPQSANPHKVTVTEEIPASDPNIVAFTPSAASSSSKPWPEEALYLQLTTGDPKSSKALSRVLKTPEEFSAAILYVGCGVALRLHRLEDAGFLFYIAHLRAQFDGSLFPPIETGASNPLLALGLLHAQLGTKVSPGLMEAPKTRATEPVANLMRADIVILCPCLWLVRLG